MKALFLVSCVSRKRSQPSKAKDLYISDWFVKARAYVEHAGAEWFILSAEYGLVAPETVIAPYERTLNAMGIADRRVWASNVTRALEPKLHGVERVVILAGARYREFLVGAIQDHKIAVEVPLEGMRIGEQLSWLKRTTAE